MECPYATHNSYDERKTLGGLSRLVKPKVKGVTQHPFSTFLPRVINLSAIVIRTQEKALGRASMTRFRRPLGWICWVPRCAQLDGAQQSGCYAALVGRGMGRGSAMGCGGAEEEAVGKLLRPLTNNNRLRHLSIKASNRSSISKSLDRHSTVAASPHSKPR